MALDLYYLPASAPCRAVMLTAEAIGLTLNYKTLNLPAGEHCTPEYEQVRIEKLRLFHARFFKLFFTAAVLSRLDRNTKFNRFLFSAESTKNYSTVGRRRLQIM